MCVCVRVAALTSKSWILCAWPFSPLRYRWYELLDIIMQKKYTTTSVIDMCMCNGRPFLMFSTLFFSSFFVYSFTQSCIYFIQCNRCTQHWFARRQTHRATCSSHNVLNHINLDCSAYRSALYSSSSSFFCL